MEDTKVAYDERYVGDVLEQAAKYQSLARVRDQSHYEMSLRLRGRGRLMGIPVIILTTVVGTSIFATLQSDTSTTWRILTGVLSVVAAVLAALQTFLNFGAEAEKNEVASNRYAAIRRRLDAFDLQFKAGHNTRAESLAELKSISQEIDATDEAAPRISNGVWDSVVEGLGDGASSSTGRRQRQRNREARRPSHWRRT